MKQRRLPAVVFSAFVLLQPATDFAFMQPQAERLPDFDKRGAAAVVSSEQNTAAATLRARLPQARVDFDGLTGAPKTVAAADGFLSGPSGRGKTISAITAAAFAPDDPDLPTKAFLQEHRNLFGHGPEALASARVKREFVTPHNGMRTVVWQQQVDAIPVFESVLISHTTRDGELVNLSSGFLPDVVQAAERGVPGRAAILAAPPVAAVTAVAAAARNVGETITEQEVAALEAASPGAEKQQRFEARQLSGPATAGLIWLPMSRQTMRLCWEVVFKSRVRGEMFRVLLDAQSGEVLVRRCLTEYISNATYRVYTSDSPSPFSPGHPTPLTTQPPLVPRVLIVTNAFNTNASPNGWIDDGVNETRGNNVDAHTDRNDDDLPDLPRPQGSPFRVFDFSLDLAQAPSTYTNAAVVQLFFLCNWYHDRLYELGFTEAAGNFQNNNFGRGGLGNDAVQADAQDGAALVPPNTNNANFSTPADGSPGRMQMYVFNGPTPGRDGDLDAEIIFHEFTHGLSNRRVGGGVGMSALQSRGMGEGWSDFYGLTLLSEPSDNVNGNYAAGGYATYLLSGLTQNYYYGIRRYPYSTDMTKNPLTFRDIDPGQASFHTGIPRSSIIGDTADEVHNQGEVWCVALWDVRANLINKYGWAIGNELILRLVTDGMNLSPANPNFLQARDAILQADLVDNGGADLTELWAAFAKRGMGFGATSPSSSTTAGVRESFDMPDDLRITPNEGFVVRGPVGGPFTPNSVSFTLTNTGSNSLSWTLVNTSSWLNVFPTGGTLTPGGASDSVTASLDGSASTLPMGIYASTIRFTNLTSGAGQSRSFSLRVGQPDYFTELFAAGDNDLDFTTFTFTPDGSVSFYSVCREVATNFPTDPAGGTTVSLSDDSFIQVTLTGTNSVAIYNRRTNVFFIGSNGYLTMNSGDSKESETFADHFNRPRVSALFHDLDPGSGGTVSRSQTSNLVAVTFLNVPEYGSSSRTNSFQIELFFDGRIRLTYLDISITDGLAGLSAGLGIPAGFEESDFSAFDPCTIPLIVSVPSTATEGDGLLVGAGQVYLPGPLATNLPVALTSSVPTEVSASNTVVIAGQTNAAFDLFVHDDALLDGSQPVVITGSASGFGDGSATITVHDNETATLSVGLPVSATEGDAPVQGTVSVSAVPDRNVTVALSSNDPTVIQVPASVIVPAGQTSAVFYATVANDTEVNGPQPVTVTAHVQNWTDGSGSITVLDNEPLTLTVTLPAPAYESAGVLTNAGSVCLAGTLATNLTVVLNSSDLTELEVPASVTITAGQFCAQFNLTMVDDPVADGIQPVTVTASASDFTNGSASISVLDDESPPVTSDPLPPDLAMDVVQTVDLGWQSGALPGQTITNDVYLGTIPTPGPAEFLGSTTNTTWNLPLLAPLTTYYWQVVAHRVGTTPGPVWQFTTKGVDHFEWNAITSPQLANTPFAATITARDEFNTVVSNFTGSLSLSGWNGSVPALLFNDNFEDGSITDWTIGAGTYVRAVTNDTAAGGSRSLTLIGGSQVYFDGISHSLSNLAPARIDFYIRASATNQAGGYVVVGRSTNSLAGFVYFDSDGTMNFAGIAAGDRPSYFANQWYKVSFIYNWTNRLVTYLRDDHVIQNNVPFSDTSITNLSVIYIYNFHSTRAWWDEIEFSGGNLPSPVAITPTNSGDFVNGAWTGDITVLQPVTNMYLVATDSASHRGTSISFDVLLADDLSVTIVDLPGPIPVGGYLTNIITVANSGPTAATGVTATNFLPASVAFVSATASQGSCVLVGSQVECSLGTLAGGTAATITVVTTPSVAGQITNFVAIGRAEADTYAGNNSAESVTTALVGPRPPTITTQPVDQTVAVGWMATFSVTASGSAPLSYFWRRNGSPIAGATQSSYTNNNVQLADSGSQFSCLVTNASGTALSSNATLTVVSRLAVVAVFDNPLYVDTGGTTGSESDNVQASLTNRGFDIVTFTDIVAATAANSVLLFPEQEVVALGPALTAGERSALSNFVATGGLLIVHGSGSSRAGGLVNSVFGLTLSESGVAGSGSSHSLTAAATGTQFADDPATVPWNDSCSTLQTASLPAGARSIYEYLGQSLVAEMYFGNGKIIFLGWDWWNAAPRGTQNGGWLTVVESAVLEREPVGPMPPSIVQQPTSQTVAVGGLATFSVTASGSTPLSYFWRRNGSPIAGATQSSYTTNNVQLADSGSQFSCLVSNAYGTALSSDATLTLRFEVLLPTLVASLEGTNTVVSWPASFSGQLESTTDLNLPVAWTLLSPQPPIVQVGDRNTVTLPTIAAQRFYRLRPD